MKKCCSCNEEITTYRYFESEMDNHYCLDCAEGELQEEIELSGIYRNVPFIRDEDVRNFYSDDYIQDLELFFETEYEGEELEELIEHLNIEVKSDKRAIKSLKKELGWN